MKQTTIILLTSLGLLQACGGGGAGGTATPPSLSVSVADGLEAMKNASYLQAQQQFCDVLKGDTTNSEAAFGCALTQYISILEAPQIQDILAGMDEEKIDIQKDIFDDGGYLSIVMPSIEDKDSNTCNDYGQFPMIPFTQRWNSIEQNRGQRRYVGHFRTSLLSSLNQNDFGLSDLQDNLFNLSDLYETILGNILTAEKNSNFSFTIPGSFFHSQRDQEIRGADLALFEMVVRGQILAEAIASQYNPATFDADRLLDANGEFDLQAFAGQLNGSLGTPFGSLKPGVPI